MGVYTTFSREALERYVRMFGIGELTAFEPIEAGIENSNYFVTLSNQGEDFNFVLTITEDLSFEEVPFFNDLLQRLDRGGLPVPNPERTLDGMAGTIFCGKPTWLFPRLRGEHPSRATVQLCEAVGVTLARIHEHASEARYGRANPYAADWAREVAARLKDRLSADDAALLERAIDLQAELEHDGALPRGIIHGDLFMDNVLTEDEDITGVIDFYHACEDHYAQDLAITLNAWATGADGSLDTTLADAVIRGYESIRPLTEAEASLLPRFRQTGAARFVLTRLISGEDGDYRKDPEEFLRILRSARSD